MLLNKKNMNYMNIRTFIRYNFCFKGTHVTEPAEQVSAAFNDKKWATKPALFIY